MRQKRAKSYRKQMLVYNHTFKFREPYQVVVDDQIVLDCDQAKFDLAKGLNRTLQAEVKPMITQCCMQALYASKNQSAISMAKEFERRRCNHPPTAPLEPHECIKAITIIKGQNKHRYVIASDNDKLRWSLRKIPGIPLVYMSRSVMVMEPLTRGTTEVSDEKESSKLTGGLNAVNNGNSDESQQQSKKRKGPKEPNPLSVLKKKKKPNSDPKPEEKKKRRRKHKKIGENNEENEEEAGESNENKEEPKPQENEQETHEEPQKNHSDSE